MGYAAEENLEATKVAVVTEEPRLVLSWRGKKIVDLSRAFLDTNGAHQETKVAVDIPSRKDSILVREEVTDVKEKWMETLKDLNVCSQKGLVEMFDGSIGASSVFMPHGGQYQMTETQAMVAKLPVLTGDCDTVTDVYKRQVWKFFKWNITIIDISADTTHPFAISGGITGGD